MERLNVNALQLDNVTQIEDLIKSAASIPSLQELVVRPRESISACVQSGVAETLKNNETLRKLQLVGVLLLL